MASNPINHASNEASYAFHKKAKRLLKNLSLNEKIGQMTLMPIKPFLKKGDGEDISLPLQLLKEKALKSSLVTGFIFEDLPPVPHAEYQALLQDIQSQTGNEIPLIFGFNTATESPLFKDVKQLPQQIGLAATWNPKLMKRVGESHANNLQNMGFSWVIAPSLDLGRNPIWPRHWESFGEDVHLSIAMGNALINGYQNEDLQKEGSVATCIKNFIGYNSSRKGINHQTTLMPEYFLREYYLEPFKAAIEQGAASMMLSSAEINGIPLLLDSYFLQDILRRELGFDEVVMTNWDDIIGLHLVHKVCGSEKEALKKVMNAGIDMIIATGETNLEAQLVELVESGAVSINRIDEAVERILVLKYKLGLIERDSEKAAVIVDEDYDDLAFTTACESITLLNNKRKALPIPASSKVLVTGPTSNNLAALNGIPSQNNEILEELSIAACIKNILPEDNFFHTSGCSFNEITHLDNTIKLASEADYIIACMGESPFGENEGNIHNLAISSAQRKFIKVLVGTGKPVILVMITGRPRLITELVPLVSAVLYGYFPGDMGGEAIAKIIFGEVNPSGKLPFTYPSHPNNILPYDHKHSEQLMLEKETKRFAPLFQFGHGLCYTKFEYDDLKLSSSEVKLGESIEISVMVTNVGKRAGKEVVQVYISDKIASMSPSVKKLRAFKKLSLGLGQSYLAHFEIHTDDLAFVNRENKWITEPGTFKVRIANLEASFEVA